MEHGNRSKKSSARRESRGRTPREQSTRLRSVAGQKIAVLGLLAQVPGDAGAEDTMRERELCVSGSALRIGS